MTIIEPGLYPDLPNYHGRRHTPTRALSASGIKVLLNETPLDFITPRDRKSDEMNFGSIVHALALGKGARFAISPFDDYRTKDARAWRDEIAASGVIPIKADKYDEAEQVASVVRSRIAAITKGHDYMTEVPFFWQEGDTWCSGMLDVWCPDLLLAIDPKITTNVGKRAAASMVNFGWDIQAAWYRRGLEKIYPDDAGRIRFVNLLVKPEAPFTSRLLMLNEAWRASAESECLRAMRIFDRCMATDTWPGYPEDIELMDAPAWTLKDRMEMEMMEEGG